MSSDTATPTVPLKSTVSRTGAALGVLLRRRDSKAVLVGSTVGYLLVYLFAIGDLTLSGGSAVSVIVADNPIRAALRTGGYFSFDPIAAVRVSGVTYLFSPINMLIAIGLSGLVGLNLSLSYLGWIQPEACGLESSSGVLAAVPALLSGAACCGPTILIVLGIQATGLLIAGFQLLVPIAVVMLVGSLLLIGRQVNPAAL